MSEIGDLFEAKRRADQERRAKNRERADPTGWTVHTHAHWSRTLLGDRLDYWPGTTRFRWRDRSYHGDVEGFIRNREKRNEGGKTNA